MFLKICADTKRCFVDWPVIAINNKPSHLFRNYVHLEKKTSFIKEEEMKERKMMNDRFSFSFFSFILLFFL